MLNFFKGLPQGLRIRFAYRNAEGENTQVYGTVEHGTGQKLPWGQRLDECGVVEHKGAFYLSVKPLQIVKEGVPQDTGDHPRSYKIGEISEVRVVANENPEAAPAQAEDVPASQPAEVEAAQ
jgi:hypothetical protein